jgi:hypothetical protein
MGTAIGVSQLRLINQGGFPGRRGGIPMVIDEMGNYHRNDQETPGFLATGVGLEKLELIGSEKISR